jgi:hypothetical protein
LQIGVGIFGWLDAKMERIVAAALATVLTFFSK